MMLTACPLPAASCFLPVDAQSPLDYARADAAAALVGEYLAESIVANSGISVNVLRQDLWWILHEETWDSLRK
jgi:hypothetical protein